MSVADPVPLPLDAELLRPDPGGAPPVGPRQLHEPLTRADRAALRPSWRQPLAVIGAVVILGWVVVAIFAPLIAPHNPDTIITVPNLSPSSQFLFGTDDLGRDVLSRVLYGARLSLPLGALLVAAAMTIGSIIGSVAGFVGGVVDAVVMRIADLFFAFPAIILAMAVAAALGQSLTHAVIAVIVVSWPSYARLSRGLVLGARHSEYVTSARLLGSSTWRTVWVELRPNVLGPIFVLAACDVANAILLLAGLSFLGLGATPPAAEWGDMVAEGTQNFSYWWIGVFPGLAISTVVLAFNFIGDALRDTLDPRTQRLLGR
ncbi:MAG TPA: ABC transporter permease [Acidimicrobiales bacterium]|nr:ABC transporter permease [Acidimicrobiales bacterium]